MGGILLSKTKGEIIDVYNMQHGQISNALCYVKKQNQKGTYYIILYICHPGKGNNCGTKNPISSCHGLGLTTKRHEEILGVMKMLHILTVVVVHRCIPLPKFNKQNTAGEFIFLYVCFISINLTLKKLHKNLHENVGK